MLIYLFLVKYVYFEADLFNFGFDILVSDLDQLFEAICELHVAMVWAAG